MFNNMFNNMLNNNCHICMENIKEHVLEPNCQNIFCGNCIIKWLNKKKSCPLCRITVTEQNRFEY